MDKIIELRSCVKKITIETHKFFRKNNKASGIRARKNLQQCKKIAQEIRMLIQRKKQEFIQKKGAAAASAAAFSATYYILGKNSIFTNDIMSTHKNNDFFKIYFNYTRLYKNSNRRIRILNFENQEREFFFSD